MRLVTTLGCVTSSLHQCVLTWWDIWDFSRKWWACCAYGRDFIVVIKGIVEDYVFLKMVIATFLTPLVENWYALRNEIYFSSPWTWKWLYNCSPKIIHTVKLLLQANVTKTLWFPLGHHFLSWDICIWNPVIIVLKKPKLRGVETPHDKVHVQSNQDLRLMDISQ